MAYPTPTIYDYRVIEVAPVASGSTFAASFRTEFSTDSGSTWIALHALPFESLVEAYQAIGILVGSESRFQAQYEHPYALGNMPIVPTQTTHAYPPA
jgi:hypothetical protein